MNQIFLDLKIVQIYWYSVIIFLAFLIGGILAIKEAKKWKIEENYMINLAFYLIIFSLIGARLYFVIFNMDYYSQNILEIFKPWEGGLAIHGGILAGLIVIYVYTKKYEVNTLRILDILATSLILGQAIGRWGNFTNGEAYGPITTLQHLKSINIPEFIINGMNINGVYHIPTFLYESLWCLLGFVILYIFRKQKYTKLGMTASLYLVWYGIGRLFIEGLRTDSLMLGNFKIAQIVSLISIILGIVMIIYLRKGSVFNNKYNDQNNTNETTF